MTSENVGWDVLKILVAVKRAVDYSVRIRVKSDQSGVDTERVKMSMNPFDEIALEAALRLKEGGIQSEIIAVSVGDAVQDVLRHALALGADRAIQVSAWQGHVPQPLQIAKVLHAVVQREKISCAFFGKQAIDTDNHQTGQMLAAIWRAAQATGVSRIEPLGASDQLQGFRVHCEVDEGLEELSVSLPCVLTADLRLNTPRYAALPQIMKAKKKPIEIWEAAALGVLVDPARVVLKVTSPPTRKAGTRLAGVQDLISVLSEEAKVL